MGSGLTLVVNAGSGSLKLRLLDDDRVVDDEDVDRWDGEDARPPLGRLLERTGPDRIEAVGHRVVHGGRRLTRPARIDERVRDELGALSELAPLHQPRSLRAIDAATDALPAVDQVACFDTAFHATLPDAAATFALPAAWRADRQVRRFGFHGLSHAWAATHGPAVAGLDAASAPRIVSCHLGSGASLCAIAAGRSVDTTMGFTPLDGLVMRTRPGTVDPGLLLWLLEQGTSLGELRDGLHHRSGLAGLAGGEGDMRDVLAALDEGDPDARLALDTYGHRLRAGIGAMTAALGGIDLLVLTGAVATHQPAVRRRAVDGLDHLGLAIDDARNADLRADGTIHAAGAVPIAVIDAREDLTIAAGTREALRRHRLAVDHVAMVGLMGSGKTTVGSIVADALHWPLLDVDEMVQQRTGRAVGDLWRTGGERAYRRHEQEVASDALAALTPSVLAAPGGAVLDPELERGLGSGRVATIYLRSSPEVLAARVASDEQPRPLIGDDPLPVLTRHHEERDHRYRELADLVLDADDRPAAALAEEVLTFLRSPSPR